LLQHWKFDVYYLAMRLADIKNGHDNQEQGLRKMAKEMAKNLKSYHYFSELKIENRLIKLTKPNEHSLKTTTKKGQQQLLLTMRFRMNNSTVVNAKLFHDAFLTSESARKD